MDDKRKAYQREYRLLNKEKLKEYKVKYTQENKDKKREYDRVYRKKNKRKIKKYCKLNKDKIKKRRAEHSKKNAKVLAEKSRIYYSNNKEKIKESRTASEKQILYRKNYYIKNRDKKNKKDRERRELDLDFRIRGNLRHRVGMAIKNNSKSESTFELLGCSITELKKHLESKFTEGMTWDNYGLKGWHIDHIIPCDAFDLRHKEAQKICFNYSNMQPMWGKDNRKKQAKIDVLDLQKLTTYERQFLKEKFKNKL